MGRMFKLSVMARGVETLMSNKQEPIIIGSRFGHELTKEKQLHMNTDALSNTCG